MITKFICKNCNNEFIRAVTPRGIREDGRGQFCSPRCKIVFQKLHPRPRREKRCVECGNIFYHKRGYSLKVWNKRTLCSRSCYYRSLPIPNKTESKRKSRANGVQILWNYNRKKLVLSKYSKKGLPKCMCCGCNLIEYLVLDHINGDGAVHKKIVRGNVMGWVIQNNFPKGFQVLCTLCNGSKGVGKECLYHKFIPKHKFND